MRAIATLFALSATLLWQAGPLAQGSDLPPRSGVVESPAPLRPVVVHPVKNDVSPPLRDIPPIPPSEGPTIREMPRPIQKPKGPSAPGAWEEALDPVVQDSPGTPNMPSPVQNFEGVNNVDGGLPPDTNGDVGPNHYVQMVNISFAIWDKSGNLLYGPAANNTLWSRFGGACQTENDGDPIVLYDHLADRWLMSQFALPNYPFGPFYQCVAISQTGDPTGAWHRYEFLISATKMNDYPKFGVWPDAYYMAVNQFNSGTGTWGGQGVVAFEREKMLAGQSARMVYFDLYSVNPNYGMMLPSDLDGPPPPTGTPNYFVEMDDGWWWPGQDQLAIWEFHVDWVTPANSTFGMGGNPNTVITPANGLQPFDTDMCGYSFNCIPQPGVNSTAYLDSISDRLMYRLQYRNFGTHQTLVVNHTVDAGGDHAGIRWYELRNNGSGWAIQQQGTYAPDSHHRWMGSIAMDGTGNTALGYSVSSSTAFPSIRYTGRLASDPLGTMPQGEAELIAGGGSQTDDSSRWGDYSMMAVDPTDDCTFWYTQEYYAATGARSWRTRIGSFKFPSCIGLVLSLNGTGFNSGGTLSLTPRVTPGATPRTVDAYVALALPDGTLLFLRGDGSLTPQASPYVSNWTISSFNGEIFRYTFSRWEPTGSYVWLAAFTEPGTSTFIRGIAQAQFTFSP